MDAFGIDHVTEELLNFIFHPYLPIIIHLIVRRLLLSDVMILSSMLLFLHENSILLLLFTYFGFSIQRHSKHSFI